MVSLDMRQYAGDKAKDEYDVMSVNKLAVKNLAAIAAMMNKRYRSNALQRCNDAGAIVLAS